MASINRLFVYLRYGSSSLVADLHENKVDQNLLSSASTYMYVLWCLHMSPPQHDYILSLVIQKWHMAHDTQISHCIPLAGWEEVLGLCPISPAREWKRTLSINSKLYCSHSGASPIAVDGPIHAGVRSLLNDLLTESCSHRPSILEWEATFRLEYSPSLHSPHPPPPPPPPPPEYTQHYMFPGNNPWHCKQVPPHCSWSRWLLT